MGMENRGVMAPEVVAERAVAAVGCGYDLAADLRLPYCKDGRLIEIEGTGARNLVLPGGIVVPDVPKSIRCDKGERTRFRSDVLSFHQMSEHFNQDMSLSGKIPSGLFNSMFDFHGCWQKDASATKSLSFDGWFITLYSIELERSHIVLNDMVKQDVPSSWDPSALSGFIEKYGTHIVVGVKMGGKDVIYIKQQQESTLQQSEVQTWLKRLADERFSDEFCENFLLAADDFPGKLKGSGTTVLKSLRSSIVTHSKSDDIVSIHVRRGGINTNQSHKQWLSTISQAPNVISMSFVPITSLLNNVRGSGFLSHAVNLYLRYKPPIEELHLFLEFQLPRLWAPEFGELPLGPHCKKHSFPSLQFTLMGPKLQVNTVPVDSENRPVTGLRLYLEGKKNNRLAIHLQHLTSIPGIIQLSEDTDSPADDELCNQRDYYEPIKWTLLSHICTAPVQYSSARIDDSASIVTKAWLEVKDIGVRKVLFLRLSFSNVASMKIRRSEWVGPASLSRKSGSISSLISSRFSASQTPTPAPKVEVNSAVFPGGPPVPIRVSKMSKFIDTTEMTRGPDDLPGYWVVTGAKLCVDGGKISLKVKFSLLTVMSEEDL
ncbi:hypothetical protein J5N97_019738 [Dioscorea zingiberensis]|uniref:MACPF domain-containing protein n=1 Tax=Dioscorea zingiberensis TaxID=325984 RepID=A0A9D5HCS4_9LILI|nr:hypothetical protein J5N97_019738 [Dioscorea zingiberensis]